MATLAGTSFSLWPGSRRVLKRVYLTKGAKVQPQKNADDLYIQAQQKLNSGHWSGAVVLLENAVAKNPYHSASHNQLGIIFQQLDITGRAQYHLEAAVRYEPSNDIFRRRLADFIYIISGDKHRALEIYSELTVTNPRDTELLQITANICIELGMFDIAQPFLRAIISLEPDNCLAYKLMEALSQRSSQPGAIL